MEAIDLTKITDPYERKARLSPALLCILPMVIAVSVSYPGIYTTLSGFVALVIAFGGLQFLSNLSRDSGKKLEKKLFIIWGGIPSVSIFRHGNNIIPKPLKHKYHEKLSECTGIAAPTEEEEAKDLNSADEIYRSWSDFLRKRARDSNKYPLLLKENINYGFRRNLLGIKWQCFFSGLLGIAIVILPKLEELNFNELEITVCVIVFVYLLIILTVINSEWVKTTAFEYAKRLVETID